MTDVRSYWPLLATAGVGLATVAYIAFYPSERWAYRKIPGPPGLPLVGNLLCCVGAGKDITQYAQQCQAKYGPVFKLWFGSKPWVVVGDTDQARRLMSRLLQRPSLRGIALLGDQQMVIAEHGLLGLKGPAWRVARKAFEAALMHKDALALHLEVMEQCVARLLARLARITAAGGGDGAIVNVAPLMGDLTMDVVGSCVFGVTLNTQELDLQQAGGEGGKEDKGSAAHLGLPYSTEELVAACRAVFDTANLATASKWVPLATMAPAWMYHFIRKLACTFPDAGQRVTLHSRQVIQDTARTLIQAWQQDHEEKGSATEAAALASAPKPASRINEKSFLGQLLGGEDLTTGTKLSHDQIIGQVFTFLLAGYETTATALTFALYLLAANPEAQRKLQAEVDSQAHLLAPPKGPPADQELNGGDHKQGNGIKGANGAGKGNGVQLQARAMSGGALTAEELARSFPYTCAVVDEALRLYPPGASAVRLPPDTIDVLGYKIPADTFVYLPIHTLQNDSDIWPDAREFKPERHLAGHPDAMDAAAKANYMPFGHGARWCPGSRFALQEARLTLVRLASRFTFTLAPTQDHPVRVRTGITVAPIGGMHLRVQDRS